MILGLHFLHPIRGDVPVFAHLLCGVGGEGRVLVELGH